MAIDMFLKVEGVTGESKDSNHTGWTDITSFSGARPSRNMSVGGGGGAGKVNFNDLHVNALIDKSTTAILKHCASGKHLTKVELSVCKAGGQQVEYTRITGRRSRDFRSVHGCRQRRYRWRDLCIPCCESETAVLGADHCRW